MTNFVLARERNKRERAGTSWRNLAACVLILSSTAFPAERIAPPHTVKIGPEQYSISVVKLGKEINGFTDNSTHYVFIGTGQDLCTEMDTVAHELFHAFLLTDRSPDMETVHEWIYDSSTPWVDLLRDNPELVRYFLQPRTPCRAARKRWAAKLTVN